MKHWINQHTQALRLVFGRMRHRLLATLVMWCVMGVTVCLPAILFVIVDNLNRLTGNISTEPQISVFMKLDAEPGSITRLQQWLTQQKDVARVTFISKDAAWKQLQQETAGAINLEKNPLPDAFQVAPRNHDPAAIEALQSRIQKQSGVELAQMDATWIKRLYAILELSKKALLVLVGLLGFALLAIIGNTIRLQVVTQREEIEVSKLIGATNRFIRRPFLYAGMVYGLGGGIAALLLLAGVIELFNYSIADIAALYASDFHLGMPQPFVCLAIVLIPVALGWLGSYVAVGRSLAKLESSR